MYSLNEYIWIPMYIDSIFCQQQHPDWSVSEEKFRITFRELAIALSEIFKEGHYYLPKLLNFGTISVSDDKKHVKLANLLKIKDGDSNSDRSGEMTDLAVTMSTFLTNVNESKPNKVRLRNHNVPDPVIGFISQCYFMSSVNLNQLTWILDFSGLWDIETIKEWVYRASAVTWRWILIRRFGKRLDRCLKKHLRKNLNDKDWRTFIPKSGRIMELFDEFVAGRRSEENEENESDFGLFNSLLRFFRNVFEHYVYHYLPPYKLRDDKVCKKLELCFGNKLLIIVRDTLFEAILKRAPPHGVNWRDMLTLEME